LAGTERTNVITIIASATPTTFTSIAKAKSSIS